jgi:phosphatidylserine/phosphatidylglycerophosphate/cardiolipin synthase-like enzyme
MTDPAAELGALLEAEEARHIAEALRARRVVHLAVKEARSNRQSEVKRLVNALVTQYGDTSIAAAVLSGIAAVPRSTVPDAVWTAPSVPGAYGRTTLAVSRLISDAVSSIYAATFSVGKHSDYLDALKDAVNRGIKLTIIVDRHMQKKLEEKGLPTIPDRIPGARVWAYGKTNDEGFPAQHSKFVIVDEMVAFVSSANFSDQAAKHNLECGLLSREPAVARSILDTITGLRNGGVLVDY